MGVNRVQKSRLEGRVRARNERATKDRLKVEGFGSAVEVDRLK